MRLKPMTVSQALSYLRAPVRTVYGQNSEDGSWDYYDESHLRVAELIERLVNGDMSEELGDRN